MRGTRTESLIIERVVGIIPAYAGNTWSLSLELQCKWDHPRVCGEHGQLVGQWHDALGSSPRMRGTLIAYMLKSCTIRIIPAYAGNTMKLIEMLAVSRDHPRVCGEH